MPHFKGWKSLLRESLEQSDIFYYVTVLYLNNIEVDYKIIADKEKQLNEMEMILVYIFS